MAYERMTGGEHRPSDDEILKTIENTTYWLELRRYLESSYDFTPEWFDGGKHGWALRDRRSGKTLCNLIPENGAFTVLVVLGKKEAEKALSIVDLLNANVRQLLEDTDQLRDGRWLWIRVRRPADVKSIKELLKIKRKPKKVEQSNERWRLPLGVVTVATKCV